MRKITVVFFLFPLTVVLFVGEKTSYVLGAIMLNQPAFLLFEGLFYSYFKKVINKANWRIWFSKSASGFNSILLLIKYTATGGFWCF